jgi:hypothetical protein
LPRLLTALLCLLLAWGVPAAWAAEEPASLVDVPIAGPLDVQALERLGLDVTHDVTPQRARLVLYGQADRATLAAAGYTARTVVEDLDALDDRARTADARAASTEGRSALPSGRETYRVLGDYMGELDALAKRHPGLVRGFDLDRRSVEGRRLAGVEIASNVNRTDDGRPVFAVFALHHAREWPSGETAMEFALDLAAGYGTDARITALLDRVRVVVVPVVNPDGFVVSRGTVPGASGGADDMWRKNCAPTSAAERELPCPERSGVDLNRNYSAGWGGRGAGTQRDEQSYRGPGPLSEPESQAVYDFSRARQITGVQSLHNVAALVLRQPGHRDSGLETPDEERLAALGGALADATGYDSIHGYELYPVHGAAEDWHYAAQGAFGFTIELGPRSSGGPTPVFHGDFRTHVVDQYLGGGAGGPAGKGVREALLLAAEQAGDPRDHALITGSAPAGAVLRVRREFKTATAAICSAWCATRGPAMQLDDAVESSLVVPRSGRFTWHVGPSTRPWTVRDGGSESWTLTCTDADGQLLATHPVAVGRGQTATVDPCEPASVPDVTPPGTGSPGDPPSEEPRRVRLAAAHARVGRGLHGRGRAVLVDVVVGPGMLRDARAVVSDARGRGLATRSFRRLSGTMTLRIALSARVRTRAVRRVAVRGLAADGTVVRSSVNVGRRRSSG